MDYLIALRSYFSATTRRREVTDLEMTKICAEAMGIETTIALGQLDSVEILRESVRLQAYDPLHNDVQAMALVKRFHLSIGKSFSTIPFRWWADHPDSTAVDKDLNRAIVECIAALKARTARAPVEAS